MKNFTKFLLVSFLLLFVLCVICSFSFIFYLNGGLTTTPNDPEIQFTPHTDTAKVEWVTMIPRPNLANHSFMDHQLNEDDFFVILQGSVLGEPNGDLLAVTFDALNISIDRQNGEIKYVDTKPHFSMEVDQFTDLDYSHDCQNYGNDCEYFFTAYDSNEKLLWRVDLREKDNLIGVNHFNDAMFVIRKNYLLVFVQHLDPTHEKKYCVNTNVTEPTHVIAINMDEKKRMWEMEIDECIKYHDIWYDDDEFYFQTYNGIIKIKN